ncbi:MAG: tetratricopeptide repeat protein [Proteobacteria bacterium]|nr:tetratricopeptide repeat protein [Pseudomonadota bacterium]
MLPDKVMYFKKNLQIIFLLLSVIQFSAADADAAKYVGRETCKSCHTKQDKLWRGSHHDLAMQHANDKAVLGDFSNVSFNYAGITSKFYKKNSKFMVYTDGPDGAMHDYEIKYTFGVMPLQQYLIEFEDGRLQALSIAWDSRDKSAGGQRWFHLYPDEKITHTDELHWTRPSFNWNGMCAECHSTNLKKNYESKKDAFKTSWSEIDVSCEACHGPASNHVSWAETLIGRKLNASDSLKGFGFLLDDRKNASWVMDDESGTARRDRERETEKEIEVCAQCHSRRSAITNNYQPGKSFADHYMPRLLDEGMYFSDGQIQDEVYVYGSFMQSKMYHKGVACSDCHEPHSLQLRQEGNGVCLQCHSAEKFDSKKHHFHKSDSTGAKCAECHMPTRDYMVVDPRHDHSIRVPRPDLSVTLGTPNACNQCHEDKHVTWAAARVKEWYGKPFVGFQKYAHALDAGRNGESDAGGLLVKQIINIETPDIARASAMRSLSSYLDQSNIEVLQKGLSDKNAMVRIASVSSLEGLPQAFLVQLAYPLIDDPVRSVRIEAARVLASIPVGQLQGEMLKNYNRAVNEYINSQQVNAERPEAQLNLGNFYAAKGDVDKAVTAYKKAIKLEDVFAPAYINLADLYRAQNRESEAEKTLRTAITIVPENADVNYALGLLLVRHHKNDEAIRYLQQAAGFDSSNAHYAYVYGVALNSTGKKSLAIEVMQDAYDRFPKDKDILNAIISFHRDAGNKFAAQTYMKKLKNLNK